MVRASAVLHSGIDALQLARAYCFIIIILFHAHCQISSNSGFPLLKYMLKQKTCHFYVRHAVQHVCSKNKQLDDSVWPVH